MIPAENAKDMMELVREAERKRDEFIGNYDKRVRDYQGGDRAHYESGLDIDNCRPVNHDFEYVSLQIPRWVYTNPDVAIDSRLPGAADVIAKAHEHALRRWMIETSFDGWLRHVALDFAQFWGVGRVGTGYRPDVINADGSNGSYRPNLSRIDPRYFVLDPFAPLPENARFRGHLWVADRKMLIKHAERVNEREGRRVWDMSVMNRLFEDQNIDVLPHEFRRSRPRDEVVGYDIWIPELQPDPQFTAEDGFPGAMLTIIPGGDDEAMLARPPTPYYGPRTGPYTIFGAYTRPNSPWPLAPLDVTRPQAEFVNIMTRAANKAAKDYRRIVIGPQRQGGVDYSSLGDAAYIEVPGWEPSQAPVTIELGGTTDQMLRQIAMAQEQLERVSGMDLAQRGQVTGQGTATEHAIADSSSETRSSFVSDRFKEASREILQSVAWFHHHDGRVSYAMGPRESADLGNDDPEGVSTFTGGPSADGEPDIPFEALDLDIVATSMQRSSEPTQQRNTLTAVQMIGQFAPMIRQFPEINWAELLEMTGDALNIPDLQRVVDYDLAQQLAQAPASASEPETAQPVIEGEQQRPMMEEAQRRGGMAAGNLRLTG